MVEFSECAIYLPAEIQQEFFVSVIANGLQKQSSGIKSKYKLHLPNNPITGKQVIFIFSNCVLEKYCTV
jgi:hypothetical protein